LAEQFRAEGQDGESIDVVARTHSTKTRNDIDTFSVLLFIDNIFRFTQAGSEVSALLGRIPSAVGYQPTLAIDMGLMRMFFSRRISVLPL